VAETQAPLLQLNQFFPYLKDHLLLDKNVDTLIIKPFLRTAYGQFRLPRYLRGNRLRLSILRIARNGTTSLASIEWHRPRNATVSYVTTPRDLSANTKDCLGLKSGYANLPIGGSQDAIPENGVPGIAALQSYT
jgi:hypothetical protein